MLERRNTESLKKIFAGYDYIMTTAQLNSEKVYYRDIQKLPEFATCNENVI